MIDIFCCREYVFYLSVYAIRAGLGKGRGLLSKMWRDIDGGREWVKNWQNYADILYG